MFNLVDTLPAAPVVGNTICLDGIDMIVTSINGDHFSAEAVGSNATVNGVFHRVDPTGKTDF